jgi:hypothetical protein
MRDLVTLRIVIEQRDFLDDPINPACGSAGINKKSGIDSQYMCRLFRVLDHQSTSIVR